MIVNRGAAEDGDLHIGDTTTLQTPEPVQVRIVGLATFGDEDGFGSVTFAGLTLDAAQQDVIKAPGKISTIQVRGAPGIGDAELTRRINAMLPDGVEAITGDELVRENTADINADFLDVLRIVLVVFAAIALLVATFSIYNTFSIIVAQRTRESALERAIGATRGQLLVATIGESLLVGVVASVAGLFGGIGIATLLKVLFGALGPGTLPAGGLEFATRTIVLSLSVGVFVTLVAAVLPAVRASRVPPLAAIRDVAVERVGAARARAVTGGVLLGLGVVTVLASVASGGDLVLLGTAVGALLTVAGVVVFGPVVARATSAVIGAPVARLRGVAGALARQNAMRNPHRTAATAAALMVGVAVVALFTVFAASLKASVDDSVSQSLRGDVVVEGSGFGQSDLSPELAGAARDLPEVDDAVGLGVGGVLVDGDAQRVTIARTNELHSVLDIDVDRGSLQQLDPTELAVDRGTADDNGWRLGTPVEVTFVDGKVVDFAIGAIYESDNFLDSYVMSRAAWAPHAVQDVDSLVLVKLRAGVDPDAGALSVQRAAEQYGVTRRPHARAVRAVRGGPHRQHPRARLRHARARSPDRLDGHRQHTVAVGLRADPRARPAPRCRRDTWSAAGHGALGVGDHRGVRHDRRARARRVPRLGIPPRRVDRHARDVRGAGRPARRRADRRGRGRRAGRDPTGSAGRPPRRARGDCRGLTRFDAAEGRAIRRWSRPVRPSAADRGSAGS